MLAIRTMARAATRMAPRAAPEVRMASAWWMSSRKMHEVHGAVDKHSRDVLLVGAVENSTISAAYTSVTHATKVAAKRHGLSVRSAEALGACMTMAMLQNARQKGEERVVVDLSTKGPIHGVYAESVRTGEVRGYVLNNAVQTQSLAKTIGRDGTLNVRRILYNHATPVTGTVPLVDGSLQREWADYWARSEQRNAVIALDTHITADNEIAYIGGALFHAHPGARADWQADFRAALADTPRPSHAFTKRTHSAHAWLGAVTGTSEAAMQTACESVLVDFFCRCSRKTMSAKLLTLGKETLEDMERQGQNELVCQFCAEAYELSHDDFTTLKRGDVLPDEMDAAREMMHKLADRYRGDDGSTTARRPASRVVVE